MSDRDVQHVPGAVFSAKKWPPVPAREPGERRKPMDRALLAIIEERSKNATGKCFANAETLRRIMWHRYGLKVHANSVRRRTRELAAKGTIGHKWIRPNRQHCRKGNVRSWTVNGTQWNWLPSEAEKREALWRAKMEKRKQRQMAWKRRQLDDQERKRQERERRRRRAPERAAAVMQANPEDRVVVSRDQMIADIARVLGGEEMRRNAPPVISPLATPAEAPEGHAEKVREQLARARALGFEVPSDEELERRRRKPPD